MKATDLPKNWIVLSSKTRPNHVYYFNVKTNTSSWEAPVKESEDEDVEHGTRSGRKRKKIASDEDTIEYEPTTPEPEPSKSNTNTQRPKLKAKRSTRPEEQKSGQRQSVSASGSKDTPQMQQLREKMLQRQAKGNATKKKKATSIELPAETSSRQKTGKSEVPKEPEQQAQSSSSAVETVNMTPQMRVLLEKIKDRKSKGGTPKSPVKSQAATEVQNVLPLRRPRTKSMASVDSVDTQITVPVGIKTRRSSRPNLNTVMTVNNKSRHEMKKDASSDKTSLNETVVMPPTRGSICDKERLKESPIVLLTREPFDFNTSCSSDSSTKIRTPRLGRSAILKKNLAEERLNKLRRSFGKDKSTVDGPSASADQPAQNSSMTHDNDVEEVPVTPPSIYKNAEYRAKFLRERMHNRCLYERKIPTSLDENSPLTLTREVQSTLDSTVNSPELFYEDMEWEPIEDEKIMQEIQVVRSHISAMDVVSPSKTVPENSLDLPDGPAPVERKALYIVVDTNVFISNIKAIEEARDAVFKTYGQPVIVVPWTVIRELDFIKDDKSMSRPKNLRAKAREAVRFLHRHFSQKHPRVLGQTPVDVSNNREKFAVECPDDEILQTCLQIRLSNNCVVLLSYDKNLCNKAMIHDIATVGRNDPLEKVDYLHASDARNESFLSLHLRDNDRSPEVVSVLVKELRVAEEILEEAKEVLTSFLTVTVAKEMQNLYNEHWEKYVIKRPPWSAVGVLQCAIKHWIAAVSDSFATRAQSILKQLLTALTTAPDSGRKLSDVSHILEMINDLLQCVKIEKYPNVVNRSAGAIAELRSKCRIASMKIHEQKLRDAIGSEDDTKEQETSADRAFQHFEEVYAFARDVGGLASQVIGMPCSFPFKKLNPEPKAEDIKDMRPDVAANLNRLLQVLSAALEDINGLHVNHRSVIALYHALYNFFPESKSQTPRNFSPQDVYYCLKKKEKMLRSGLVQLQELSTHFCRMTSFRCT